MIRVLSKRPYHYNSWSFALERWEPNTKGDFPSRITFWIQSKCLPPEYRNDEALRSIGSSMGEVINVDEKSAKLQVTVDVSKPLLFDKKAISEDGEEVTVTFKYEKLHRYCFTCKMISHEERYCPLLTEEEKFQKRIERANVARLAEEEEANLFHPKPVQNSYAKSSPPAVYSREKSRSHSIEPSNKPSFSHRDSYRRESKFSEPSNHRPNRNPQDYAYEDYKDRVRRPVWNRLSDRREQAVEKFPDLSYPRHRENFKIFSEDQKRRRADESVATSSWKPRSASSRDDDTRTQKYQKVEERDQRDVHHRLGKRQDLGRDYRGDSRREYESDFYKHKEFTRSGHKQVENNQPARGADGSKTITDLGFRLIHSHGQSFYRDISSKKDYGQGYRASGSHTFPKKGKQIAREDFRPISGSPSEKRRPVNYWNRPGIAVVYRVKSPLADSQAKSQAQLSIDKEVAELSAKKISISIPSRSGDPLQVTENVIVQKQFSLSEEEEQQVIKDAADCTAPLTEEEEKDLLICAEKDAAKAGGWVSDMGMEQEEVDNDDLLEEELQISVDRTISDPIKPLSRRARLASFSSPPPSTILGFLAI